MSESHPGAGRHGHDPDHRPEPDPGSSVFDRPVASPSTEPYRAPSGYPAQSPYPETARHPGQPPYEPQPAHPGQPPYPDQPGYPGQPPYPDQPGYPGQVHVPAPPPQPPTDPGYPPDFGERPPPQADRRPPRRRRPEEGPGRSSGIGFPFGAGTVVGVAGLVCFLLGLLVLPWFTSGGEEVTLADIRTSFTIPETQPEDLPGASTEEQPAPGPDGVPSPGEVGDAVEGEVRNAAAVAAADAIDAGKSRYLELYTETLWIFIAVAVALAVLFSTILTPRSFALSLLLGFRRLSGFVTVLAGASHAAALWIVFTGDGAPTPGFGVWLGVGGLAAVLVACVLGPKR